MLMSIKDDVQWRSPEIQFDAVDEAMAIPASAPGPDDGNSVGSQKPTRVRVEFPETWLWSDSVTGYPSGCSTLRVACLCCIVCV